MEEFDGYAHSVGVDLRPWQYSVAERLLEVDADGLWCWAPAPFLLLIPRQLGKSVLLRTLAMWLADQGRVVLSASNKLTGITQVMRPAQRWARDVPDMVVLRRYDQPEIGWPGGGRWVGQAANLDLGRGWTIDAALIDEVQSVPEPPVTEGLMPAMSAVDNPLTLLVGTAARGGSPLLTRFRDAALQAGDAGALAEWSAPPGSDHRDEQVWRACSPYWTPGRLRYLRAQLGALSESAFRAEYLCQPQVAGAEPWLNLHSWSACRIELDPPPTVQLAAVEDDRGDGASVALLWTLPDGTAAVWAALTPTLDAAWVLAGRAHQVICGVTLAPTEPARFARATAHGARETGRALPELRRMVHQRRVGWSGDDLDYQVRTCRVKDAGAGALSVAPRPLSGVLRVAAWVVAWHSRHTGETPRIYV